jgi:hypothetical protein
MFIIKHLKDKKILANKLSLVKNEKLYLNIIYIFILFITIYSH